MNSPTGSERDPETLDNIIDRYVASSEGPGYRAMLEWISRYPQYEQELVDFTVHWSAVREAPALELRPEEARREAGLHMPTVRRLIEKYSAPVEAAPLEGLVAEARARGLSPKALAEKAGLSLALVTKLDRRLLSFATIPQQVLSILANTLGREVEAVARYLQGGALMAPATVRYRADKAPALPGQQDFREAVQTDRTLTEEQKATLLSYAAPSEQ
jgi:hypothetical protein